MLLLAFGLLSFDGGWYIGIPIIAGLGWMFGGYVRQLRRQAERDDLTGIANRRPFDRALFREWKASAQSGRPLSLVFLDVDDFGLVNKHHGHLMGDEVLRAITRQIRLNVRRGDLMARWGGEEFVILLPGSDQERANSFAERIRSVVEQCSVCDRDKVVSVTISTGVATYPGKSRSAPELLREAIDAQMGAKRQKNSVSVVS